MQGPAWVPALGTDPYNGSGGTGMLARVTRRPLFFFFGLARRALVLRLPVLRARVVDFFARRLDFPRPFRPALPRPFFFAMLSGLQW